MTRSWKLMTAVLTLAAVAAASPLWAAEKEGKAAKSPTFVGKISAIDEKAMTITVAHKGKKDEEKEVTKTFKLGADAKIWTDKDKDAAKLGDLKVGDKVEVEFSEAGGVLTAHRVAEKGSHARMKENKAEKTAPAPPPAEKK